MPQSRTESIRLSFNDGEERNLLIHGLQPLQLISVFDELGYRSWEELQADAAKSPAPLRTIKFAVKVAARALSFRNQDPWTDLKVQESLTDTSVRVAFVTAIKLSGPPELVRAMDKALKPVKAYERSKTGVYG